MLKHITSIWNRANRNNINSAIDVLNQLGVRVQDLVAEGQLTPSQYATLLQTLNGLVTKGNVSVNDINKNLGKFDSTYFSDAFLNNLANGQIDVTNLLPRSVTSDRIAVGAVSRVELSGAIAKHNIINGVLIGANLEIDFEAGTVYVPSPLRLISNNNNNSVSNVGATLNLDDVPSNIMYVAVNYSDYSLTLSEFSIDIQSDNRAVVGVIDKANNTSFIAGSHVVIDGSRKSFENINAVLESSRTNLTIDFTSKKLIATNSGRPHISFNDDFILFPSGESSFDGMLGVLYITYNRQERVFECLPNITTIIDYNQTPIIGLINLNDEEVFIQGVGYRVIRTNEEPSGGVGLSQPFHFLGDPGGPYIPKIEDYYYPVTSQTNLTQYMDAFEELRSNNPGYVTREVIGTSVEGREIYRYDFNYYDVMNKIDDRPIIYINASIHGVEHDGHYAVLAFLKDLCDNWLTNEQLGFIHNNVHLVVVPAANPDGFVANTRGNANGVDINRNFTRGWNNDDNLTVGDLQYPGTGPLSEPETQAIEALLENIKPFYTFDIHNNGSLESKKDLISISTGPDRLRYFVKAFGNSFDYRMRKQFPEIANWNHADQYNFVMDRLANPGGSLAYSAVSLGSNGSTVEFTTGWEPHDPVVHQYINKDAMGNLILGAMRSTDRL